MSSDGTVEVAGSQLRSTAAPSIAEDGTNASDLKCLNCPCVILKASAGRHLQESIFLPYMRQKRELVDDLRQQSEACTAAVDGDAAVQDTSRLEGTDVVDHWLCSDIFAFENIGVSKTVSGIKYLICADCEMGPIGYHDTREQPPRFLLAAERSQSVK